MTMMNKQEFDYWVDAYEKLKEIPHDEWITGRFTDGEGACCAVGHHQRLKSSDPHDYRQSNCHDVEGTTLNGTLRKISRKVYCDLTDGSHADISAVNNGYKTQYNQSKIKDRVMQFMEDGIDMVDDQYFKNHLRHKPSIWSKIKNLFGNK